MRMKHLIAAALTALTLSGCSLVYRIDIPQGNYVEQKQVDKLRQGMTREQVEFVLGSPCCATASTPTPGTTSTSSSPVGATKSARS